MSVIVEAFELAEKGRVVRPRHWGLSDQPGEDLLVGEFHQLLERAKLAFIEARELRVRESPHQQVHFAHAAMPSTKTQPPPANLGVGKHELRALSLRRGDVPIDAGRPYIARPARRVMGRATARMTARTPGRTARIRNAPTMRLNHETLRLP